MSWFWDEFFRRRRRFPFFSFADIDRLFREMEREMEEAFKEIESRVPRELVRERVLPDGTRVREFGPFVYGYSITFGPDGKPVINEFGNIKPTIGRAMKPSLMLRERREPLVDVLETEDEVKVVAELPGVEKEDIELSATGRMLTISVDTPERKYYKELELPVEVEPETAKSTYKNGILEVTLKKRKVKPKGYRIKVE
ncbi:MAG: archaeal heat shock protein Hsp20 [Candidatus Freyarchaeota archaeon]